MALGVNGKGGYTAGRAVAGSDDSGISQAKRGGTTKRNRTTTAEAGTGSDSEGTGVSESSVSHRTGGNVCAV